MVHSFHKAKVPTTIHIVTVIMSSRAISRAVYVLYNLNVRYISVRYWFKLKHRRQSSTKFLRDNFQIFIKSLYVAPNHQSSSPTKLVKQE